MPDAILLKNCTIVSDSSIVETDRFITTSDNTISAVGSMAELRNYHAGQIIDCTNKLVLPGLLNGHCHSPMTLFRGLADDLELHDWLHNYIFPSEMNYVDQEMVYWCSKLAAVEMMLSGTTCVADGYFHSAQTARAFSEAGLRATVAHGVLDFPAPGVPDPSENISIVEKYILDWSDNHPLIHPAVFAHSPYTCSPETLLQAKKLADKHGVRFFIHLAESHDEHKLIINPKGKTPLQHLDALGILDENCVLIHCIWLSDEDLEIIARQKTHIVLCPQSNYKLASGMSRASDMISRGISVGLGTDGCASNNSLDMFREMDLFAKSHKAAHSDPTLFPASQVAYLATTGNNTVLGLSPDIGIAAGKRADLIILNLDTPHLTPFYNQDILVYSASGSDVESVIINGRLVVYKRNIQTLDVEETYEHIHRLAQQVKMGG